MPIGNDFCNNELLNAVFHLAATDAERGIPAVGKPVFRTDSLAAEICVDTSPNADEDGGGTWTSIGGGAAGDLTDIQVIEGGATAFDTTGADVPVYARWSTAGKRAFIELELNFSANGTPGGSFVVGLTITGGPDLSPRNAQAVTPPTPQPVVHAGSIIISDGSSTDFAAFSVVGAYSAGTTTLLGGFNSPVDAVTFGLFRMQITYEIA